MSAYGLGRSFAGVTNLYDRMYHWKDYASEAETVRQALSGLGVADGARVVEAACGTGSYLEQLRRWYDVSGFDLDPEMVTLAQEKLSDLKIWQADMVDFDLEEPAAAIVCLFSSIGYVYPEERLRQVAQSMFRNLVPGGAVIVEPWLRPNVATPDHISQQVYDAEDMKLCRATLHEVEGRKSVMDMNWLVTTRDGIEHFIDHHELWMYTEQELLDAFGSAGFEVSWSEEGIMPDRGIVLGRRPG